MRWRKHPGGGGLRLQPAGSFSGSSMHRKSLQN